MRDHAATLIWLCIAVAVGVACTESRPVEQSRLGDTSESGVVEHAERRAVVSDASPPNQAPKPAQTRRTRELCPHAFEPSLEPIDPPTIHAHNSARRVQAARRRIERIEVIDASTYRLLFVVDDATVAALHRTPAEPPIEWNPNLRTMSLPAWKVALLVFVVGDSRPYLGHLFDDGQLYFVDEPDPWDTAVFDDEMNPREVFSIPTNVELADALVARFGDYDPFDQIAAAAQRAEDARCGRVSKRSGDPFPDLPKAIIEPVDGH